MSNELTQLEKIYAKFKKLKDEAEADCKFDKSQIDSSFNNTNLLMKYINKKTEWSRVYRDFEIQRKKQYRTLYEFYQTDYPRKLTTKDEYQLFIESDIAYLDCYNNSQVVKEVVLYIDSVIETLKGRAFLINQAIKWVMFQNGVG